MKNLLDPRCVVAQPADEDRRDEGRILPEIEDRLVEKRERLNYFIITASTAVIAFTFNNLNSPEGILRQGSLLQPLTGWSLLFLASVAALYLIRRRHTEYARYLDELHKRTTPPSENVRARYRDRIAIVEFFMIEFFLAGMALLIIAHAVALLTST